MNVWEYMESATNLITHDAHFNRQLVNVALIIAHSIQCGIMHMKQRAVEMDTSESGFLSGNIQK